MNPTTDRLTMNLWRSPETATVTLSKAEAKDLMESTGGEIIACGKLWRLVKTNLGFGLYKFRCKEVK